MTSSRLRKGVASVVGVLLMTLVFMAAIGAQTYLAGLQAQSAEAAGASQQRMGQRTAEGVGYSASQSGLVATGTGPTGETLVGMVLKFENGTVYNLGPSTVPAFIAAAIPSGGQVGVRQLVPSGVCSPGTATCLAKYDAIVGGPSVPGRGVAVVTSLGNAFWYFPSAGQGASDPSFYGTPSNQATNSGTFVPINGLSFAGNANSFYRVEVFIVYFQSSSSSPVASFAVSAPSGTNFVFCGGLHWANPSSATTDLGPANLCTYLQGTSLGATDDSQTWCTQQLTSMCEFTGTAFVMFGASPGTFQFEFEGSSLDTVTVLASSAMIVTPG